MSKSAANFVQALVAVIVGNVAYLLSEKYLPVPARHVVFKLDLGTLVDFWYCLVAFGIVKMVASWRERRKLREE